MGKQEALKVNKALITLNLEQLKDFHENIPKEQRKEEYKFIEPMIEDKLFLWTGIEREHLQIVLGILKMD